LRDTLLDDNRGTALHAAQALGNFGEPAVEPLIKFLKRCYQYQVATVAEVLVRLKDPRAIEPLSGWITDKTAGPAAVAAIAALGGPAAVVEQLVARLMRTDDMLVNHDLLKALESQGPSIDRSSAPLLVPLLTHWDRDTRKMAADMLALHGWQPADDAQRAAFAVARRNWDEAVRLGSPSVDPLIRGLLGAARHLKGVSEYTAALARIGTPAMDRLIAMLASDNSQERRAAATALGEAGDARAIGPLIAALNDAERDVRKAASAALGKLGPTAVEPLVLLLSAPDKQVRRDAIAALGELGDRHAVELLIAALGDEDFEVRSAAASALGKLGDARAVEPLIAALPKTASAAYALAQLDDARAVEGLIAALNNPQRADVAALALANLGDAHAVGPLLRMASNKDDARKTIDKLVRVLEHDAARCTDDDLRAAAHLTGIVQYDMYAGEEGGDVGVDCTKVNQLARQELIRRGLEA
jgi:HEAT repeat protein